MRTPKPITDSIRAMRDELEEASYASALMEQQRDDFRRALLDICNADPVDMALDPNWASRVAKAALLEHIECDHEWVDARNKVVISGEMCPKCGAVREGNQLSDVEQPQFPLTTVVDMRMGTYSAERAEKLRRGENPDLDEPAEFPEGDDEPTWLNPGLLHYEA